MLFIGGLVGVFAVLPHLRDHVAEFFAAAALIGVCAIAGTYFAPRVELQSQVLDAVLAGRSLWRRSLRVLVQGVGFGVVTALVLMALDVTLFAPQLAAGHLKAATSAPPLWTGALYGLSGGISEEVVFHYGLLTAVAWAGRLSMSGMTPYWFAIILTALALGLFHLLSAGAQLPLIPLVVTRTVVFGAIAGIVTGWLYWRRGLETAMLAHGVVSSALHVVAPGAFG